MEIDDIRLIPAPISINFSELSDEKKDEFELEFQKLSDSDDDPIGRWIKLAKARGETNDTDKVLLELLVELHRKVDNLESLIKKEKPKRIKLNFSSQISSIGFEHFKLKEKILEKDKIYYGRIEMPVHPKRDVAVFFKALSSDVAEFTKMHERDQKEWNSYVTARERVLIRELRAKQKSKNNE